LSNISASLKIATMSGYGQIQNGSGAGTVEIEKPVTYLCGDCAFRVSLSKGDPIRCTSCGYRVLYKERTNR
jgi:DNA-directed RNA polymerase I, II, and III subunit RPABC4